MTEKESQEHLERRFILEEEAAVIADVISEVLPQGLGFTLLLTETGEGKQRFAIRSTLERESTIQMMKILLEKWRANQ